MNPTEKDPKFEVLLEYLRYTRGFDFTGYKRSSLMRRVTKRMQECEVKDFGDYLDYLEVHPGEFTPLFNTILINVTGFFRDPAAWECLGREVVPRVLAGKQGKDPIRAWSAGCSTGEEAYTMAIILAEAVGVDQCCKRVKIYATDIDEEALNQARQGSYSAKDLEAVPSSLRTKYFNLVGNRYIFSSDLRRSIIFGRHDLTQDAPISRLDILVCRNTLMYFNTESQARILDRFHFALQDRSVLFLGKAEMIFAHAHLFAPLDMQNRTFIKVSSPRPRDRIVVLSHGGEGMAAPQPDENVRLREVAFDSTPAAQVVVGRNGNLVLANEEARALFGLSPQDLARPFQDLEISYRPLELRSMIEQVYAERRTIILTDVERHLPDGQVQYLDVQVKLLQDNGSEPLGVSISFRDVTRHSHLQEELQRSQEELKTAYEELQATNEELETTNEELQSAVEELQTTNEELQSTTEEVETTNEELQATNEELQAMNELSRERAIELNRVNTFLASILGSVRAGIVVVDRDLKVLLWNSWAENVWGLRAGEAQGQSLLELDIGLPVEQLRVPAQAFLDGKTDHREILVDATNRRGKAIRCRITFTPCLDSTEGRHALVLLTEEG